MLQKKDNELNLAAVLKVALLNVFVSNSMHSLTLDTRETFEFYKHEKLLFLIISLVTIIGGLYIVVNFLLYRLLSLRSCSLFF